MTTTMRWSRCVPSKSAASVGMTMQQLGAQWLKNSAGSWGSSEQALLPLKRGIEPPDTGRAGHRATVNTFNSTTYKGRSVVI